ncbi:N-acyl-D-amino-acid deacylase family protein [Sphingomonas colocasiae]|uniref:Amidohydrolase family protein n=1 Tax=Sphingomonas colocasiae TaxID=1848973 RepID=A0ABS7PM91_9SPHN|nr:amidohydrolase family protein [Sphingomonas colocasiae]MBY8822430.1 amidohydrolase family protein [Sphingomonas colocasiae]
MAVIEDGGAMPRRRFLKQALAGSIVAVSAAHGRSPSRAGACITNIRLIDGTGAAARRAAVRIAGGRIVEIGATFAPRAGEAVHDGQGQVLAPGFIDTHSHHDRGLPDAPDAAALLSQGVTTIVVGQDGSAALPLRSLWGDLAKTGAAVNVASYSGHNSLRAKVMGEDYRRAATTGEIERMKALLDADMRAGAIGLSSGLGYDPGIYSASDEVVALCKTIAPYGGRYISHIRSENVNLWASIDELIRIGREARVPVQLSHAKLSMASLWGQSRKLLDRLDAARAQGIDATLDIYPYEYWQSTMTVMLPDRDFDDIEAARFALRNFVVPERVIFNVYDADPTIVGKTLAALAAERGRDPAELYLELIRTAVAADKDESIIAASMSEADIATMMRWPHANICSDGEMRGGHPRGAGSFSRILRKYVREDGVLTLEQAVHKMSGLAADHMGFRDRGRIRPGQAADLVLFDPDIVRDHASIETPRALSTGISRVWVNGEPVWHDARATGALPGQTLLNRHPLG